MTAQDDGSAGLGVGLERLGDIRRRLDRGADPQVWSGGRPLHRAAVFGSPEVVAELARRVADVDAPQDGVTAVWEAVLSRSRTTPGPSPPPGPIRGGSRSAAGHRAG